MRKFFAGGAVALGVTAVGLAPALAASTAQTIPVQCGQQSYEVTTNGNGNWTPARDNNSTLVFHPTSFGEFTGTFTPSDPNQPPQTETDPPQTFQAQPANGHPTVSCTYTIHFVSPDGTFDGSGSVAGWTSGTPQH